jgi:Domain of unknown function (DUF397)
MSDEFTAWRTSTRSVGNGACVEVGWRTSSHSGGGNCVQVWRKSTHSGGGNTNCVEVGCGGPLIAVRDTKDHGTGPVLTFTGEAWEAFTAALKAM